MPPFFTQGTVARPVVVPAVRDARLAEPCLFRAAELLGRAHHAGVSRPGAEVETDEIGHHAEEVVGPEAQRFVAEATFPERGVVEHDPDVRPVRLPALLSSAHRPDQLVRVARATTRFLRGVGKLPATASSRFFATMA